MMNQFSVRSATIDEIFDGEFRFTLPWFQRAYGWPTTQVARLVGDVREAIAANGRARHYPLGTVMLARREGAFETAIVDGHQRIMTLTLIFAVLRDLEDDEGLQRALDRFICVNGSDAGGRVYRVAPQAGPEAFIARTVQMPGATGIACEDEIGSLSASERAIVENRDFLRTALGPENLSPQARRDFARFLAKACWMIVQIVPDEAEAWRMLSIEEETRLAFTDGDQAKATLLSVMPATDRDASAVIWENSQRELGGEDCHALLGHVRRLTMRKRSAAPLETDLCKVFALDKSGLAFMEGTFKPAAERLIALRTQSVGSGNARAAIGASLTWLHAIERHAWVSAALLWLERRGENHADTAQFFHRLERFVWMTKIAGVDPTVQETHLLSLLKEVDNSTIAVGRMRYLSIDAKLKKDAIEALDGANYFAKQCAAVVMRRLEAIYGADPGPLDRDRLTIEHILPRNPPARSPWRQRFTSKSAIAQNTNRLGNLTFLTPPDNQKAGTSAWPDKRPILSGSAFAMTRRAAYAGDWDGDQIRKRTREMTRDLLAIWDLTL